MASINSIGDKKWGVGRVVVAGWALYAALTASTKEFGVSFNMWHVADGAGRLLCCHPRYIGVKKARGTAQRAGLGTGSNAFMGRLMPDRWPRFFSQRPLFLLNVGWPTEQWVTYL